MHLERIRRFCRDLPQGPYWSMWPQGGISASPLHISQTPPKQANPARQTTSNAYQSIPLKASDHKIEYQSLLQSGYVTVTMALQAFAANRFRGSPHPVFLACDMPPAKSDRNSASYLVNSTIQINQILVAQT